MKSLNPGMFLLCGLLAACATGQSWNHNPPVSNGPLNWGSVTASYATCGTTTAGKFVEVGAKQTPIDIQTANAVEAVLPDLNFRYKTTPFDVENTGHVVEVMYDEGSYLRIGPSLLDRYQLLQFHFHTPSEHTIDGKQYDAELHLVHANRLGELAVVGVLLTKSATAPAGTFDDILTYAPFTSGGTFHVAGVSLNARNLLPGSGSYYSYSGSLTTPPCTEGVRWFVMAQPVAVRDFVISQLHSITSQFSGYNNYPNNNRPVAPLNGRTVLVVR